LDKNKKILHILKTEKDKGIDSVSPRYKTSHSPFKERGEVEKVNAKGGNSNRYKNKLEGEINHREGVAGNNSYENKIKINTKHEGLDGNYKKSNSPKRTNIPLSNAEPSNSYKKKNNQNNHD